MANCKICGKLIPDGKTICNNCRMVKMSSENKAAPADDIQIIKKDSTVKVAERKDPAHTDSEPQKNSTLVDTNKKAEDATNMFSAVAASDNDVKKYREPSRQSYVKYNGIDKKAIEAENSNETTMFNKAKQTGGNIQNDKQNKNSSNISDSKEVKKDSAIVQNICGIASSYFFAAACLVFTLYCVFAYADAISKLNPFLFILFIINSLMCIHMWILFIKAKVYGNFDVARIRSIRKLTNTKFAMYFMLPILSALVGIAIFVVDKFGLFEEADILAIIAPLVFKTYTEGMSYSSVIQDVLLIYLPVIAVMSISFAYIIKFLHAVYVNFSTETAKLGYSVHAVVSYVLAIGGAIFCYFADKAVFSTLSSLLNAVLSAIEGLPLFAFASANVDFGIIKLITFILFIALMIFTTLVYKVNVTDKSKPSPRKTFKLFSE